MLTKDELLRRINFLKILGSNTIESSKSNRYLRCDPNLTHQFRSGTLALLKDLYGDGDHHYKDFDSAVVGNMPTALKSGMGIIQAVVYEVEHDWLTNTRALIAASLFSDFLEMSKHLSEEGYKDAAAVIAGSSLEAHLRRLADTANVQTVDTKGKPRKADALNADLHKAGVYGLSEQKQVTAWLDIRNNAAHGHYPKVIDGAVSLMIDGIRHFMMLHPA
jgi:hypothetical protein